MTAGEVASLLARVVTARTIVAALVIQARCQRPAPRAPFVSACRGARTALLARMLVAAGASPLAGLRGARSRVWRPAGEQGGYPSVPRRYGGSAVEDGAVEDADDLEVVVEEEVEAAAAAGFEKEEEIAAAEASYTPVAGAAGERDSPPRAVVPPTLPSPTRVAGTDAIECGLPPSTSPAPLEPAACRPRHPAAAALMSHFSARAGLHAAEAVDGAVAAEFAPSGTAGGTRTATSPSAVSERAPPQAAISPVTTGHRRPFSPLALVAARGTLRQVPARPQGGDITGAARHGSGMAAALAALAAGASGAAGGGGGGAMRSPVAALLAGRTRGGGGGGGSVASECALEVSDGDSEAVGSNTSLEWLVSPTSPPSTAAAAPTLTSRLVSQLARRRDELQGGATPGSSSRRKGCTACSSGGGAPQPPPTTGGSKRRFGCGPRAARDSVFPGDEDAARGSDHGGGDGGGGGGGGVARCLATALERDDIDDVSDGDEAPPLPAHLLSPTVAPSGSGAEASGGTSRPSLLETNDLPRFVTSRKARRTSHGLSGGGGGGGAGRRMSTAHRDAGATRLTTVANARLAVNAALARFSLEGGAVFRQPRASVSGAAVLCDAPAPGSVPRRRSRSGGCGPHAAVGVGPRARRASSNTAPAPAAAVGGEAGM